MFALLLAHALAAPVEIAAEFATVPVTDDSQARFGRSNVLPAFGGRAGIALTDALTVQLAAHHGRRGAQWNGISGATQAAAAFYATDVALGLEAVIPINPYFAVGGVASGTGQIGVARFDDDVYDRDSPVQVREQGFAPGFRAAAAVRISVPDSALPAPLQFRISTGYQWSARLPLGVVGSTALRGFSLRTSFGLQF